MTGEPDLASCNAASVGTGTVHTSGGGSTPGGGKCAPVDRFEPLAVGIEALPLEERSVHLRRFNGELRNAFIIDMRTHTEEAKRR